MSVRSKQETQRRLLTEVLEKGGKNAANVESTGLELTSREVGVGLGNDVKVEASVAKGEGIGLGKSKRGSHGLGHGGSEGERSEKSEKNGGDFHCGCGFWLSKWKWQ
jgi:hypothetical protein